MLSKKAYSLTVKMHFAMIATNVDGYSRAEKRISLLTFKYQKFGSSILCEDSLKSIHNNYNTAPDNTAHLPISETFPDQFVIITFLV